MKVFIRRAVARVLTVGALGLGALGPVLLPAPAMALSQEQIAQQRSTVLAYVLVNEQGLVLYPGLEDEADQLNLLVFMSAEEAQSFLEQNELQDTGLEIALTNLERIHQAIEDAGEQTPQLVLIPETAEVQQAVAIDESYQGGVPLFFAQLEDGSFAPLSQDNGEPVFPMFFSRADLEAALSDLGERDPEARAALSVGVLPLQAVLEQIITSDDELLAQIRLLPPEVVEVIRNQQEGEAAPAAPAAE